MSYMDIAELIEKLYCTDRDFKQCFLEVLNNMSKSVGDRGFLPEGVAAPKGVVGIFMEKRITILSASEFQQEFGQEAL